MTQAKEYIKTELFNNTQFRLKKEYDGSITLNSIYSPYKEWSNCTDIEYNIRLTPKRLYIVKSFFSDTSGQQRNWVDKKYMNRNKEIDDIFNGALSYQETNDEIETHADLENIFNFFNNLYLDSVD